jgi:FtsZ-binding cell division protein ZapB
MDTDKKAIIGRARELKAQGLSFQAIADAFNGEGIPTFSGRGVWNKGTLLKLLKAESDTVKEKPELKSEVDALRSEKDSLCSEIESLKSELDMVRDKLGNKERSLSELQKVYDGVLCENDRLNQCLKETESKFKGLYESQIVDLGNRLAEAKAEIETLKHKQMMIEPEKSELAMNNAVRDVVRDKKPSENINGWTVRNRKGYLELFKKIVGKSYSVYWCKEGKRDVDRAIRLTSAKEKEVRDRLGIKTEVREVLGKQTVSFENRLRAVFPDENRTYRLDKVRAQFPNMDKSEFDIQMIALAGELKIELLAGDQRECNPDNLIADGNRLFVNFEWR